MQAVVLCAGESSRFWPLNSTHKSLTVICGKPILEHLLIELKKAKFKRVLFVVNNTAIQETFGADYKGLKLQYAVQSEAKGMGDAILAGVHLLEESFYVVNPNQLNVRDFVKKMKGNSLVVTETNEPWRYGVVALQGDKVTEVVEKPEHPPSNKRIVGVYRLNRDFLKILKETEAHHYHFEEALNKFCKTDTLTAVETKADTLTLKYPWDVLGIMAYLLKKQKGVVIEKGAVVEKSAVVKAPAYIGRGAYVGDHTLVRAAALEEGAEIGFGTEVARALVGSHSHIHSGFIGDSIVGPNVRIGAQFVTANRRLDRGVISAEVKGDKVTTGLTSFGCAIGEGTKIGIHVSTMPGILIGRRARIGPSTVVNKNISDNSKFYSEFTGVVKSE